MNNELYLSLKITNWCNLCCRHCCECSDPNQVPNFIPLEKIDKYLYESRKMFIVPNPLLCIGGGEAMAPYMYGMSQYIPYALDLVYKYNYIPTIKTNGTWGDNDNLRTNILHGLAKSAYKAQKLVTLDISVDEFHNNHSGVIKIIQETLSNSDLCFAIRICLVGFNTQQSKNTLDLLQYTLQSQGFDIVKTIANDWIISSPNGENGVYMVNDFAANIYNLGRAKDNNVFTSQSNPNGNDGADCLQLDNNDTAIFNYMYREQIKNRTLNDVLKSIIRNNTR